MRIRSTAARLLYFLALLGMLLSSGCLPATPVSPVSQAVAAAPTSQAVAELPMPTPISTRPVFQPGELVDYTAQMGDNLEALAARFNTTVAEIRTANPIIPDSATTMPPGMPMKIPIYYLPLWGTPYQIIPDSLYINGPAQVSFDPVAFVDQQPGWLKNHTEYAGGVNRRGGEIVAFVAMNYSVSPQLLLAIAEYQTKALSSTEPPGREDFFLLGKNDFRKEGFYRQLTWAADTMNDSYYQWRIGRLLTFEHLDGRLERPDPWQNAATVALQHYFSLTLDGTQYERAISGVGLGETYRTLFGDPWANVAPHIPGSLEQPAFRLPFEPGPFWAYTGGPHNAWGEEVEPLAALDFAPPAVVGGCKPAEQWATAVADGVISRTGEAIAVLDLDGDGDERTGWTVFYLHLESATIPPAGTQMKAGQRIGKPSCEGGRATGTHVHIARKYNGEWMLADGTLAFNLEGWVARAGSVPYEGMLYRSGKTVNACVCSDFSSQLNSTAPPYQP
jgi:murein DD-endopeptidase MepM/ murein hydrolase activator NlpD